jgi:hypothetical protein
VARDHADDRRRQGRARADRAERVAGPRASGGVGELESVTHWRNVLRSYAVEHGMFVMYAGLAGFEGGKGMTGSSALLDPFGETRRGLPALGAAILRAEVDFSEIDVARAQPAAARRPRRGLAGPALRRRVDARVRAPDGAARRDDRCCRSSTGRRRRMPSLEMDCELATTGSSRSCATRCSSAARSGGPSSASPAASIPP